MKTLTIIFGVILAFCICGCSDEPEFTEVTKDNFSKFESSEFTKVCIRIHMLKAYPEKRSHSDYFYDFPITARAKIDVIKLCIRDANHTEYDWERYKKLTGENRWLFVFETRKFSYRMYIGWDDKSAYGLWWDSPELLSIFRGWGLFEDVAKADPNWPPPKWYVQNRFDEKNRAKFSNPGELKDSDSNDTNDLPAWP